MLQTAPIPSASESSAAFILTLRSRGFRDRAVLGAMERVPREMFAARRFADLARTDVALPLPCGQTMTAPGTVAAMLVALRPEPGATVLELGTGSGYTAALLAHAGCRTLSLERYATLAEAARARLDGLGLLGAVEVEEADGLALPPEVGTFARVLVNGVIEEAMLPQVSGLVAPGGRLVAALRVAHLPRLLTLDRDQEGVLRQTLGGPLRIDPIRPRRAAAL